MDSKSRREQELRQLAGDGVPLRTFGKTGHWAIGPLHIYTAAGRWLNEQTGRRGRLKRQNLRSLIEREYPDALSRTISAVGMHRNSEVA
ncbi:MAG: hypothetical protein JOZ62_04885 [Acidobacteriaceae bacterium]|nr:hypothetical protein [Acidobacteriaceae bacterium]